MGDLFGKLLHECTSQTGLRSQEARVIFKAGKNCYRYFDCADLCSQTEKAIELFEDNFSSTAVAAFVFDNSPAHQKHANNALSAYHMPKIPKRWLGKYGWGKIWEGENHPDMPGCV